MPLALESLDQWQSNAARLEWAATDPTYRSLVSMATNERVNLTSHLNSVLPPGCILTENARYGALVGFEACLHVLRQAAIKSDAASAPPDEVDYPPPATTLFEESATS